MSLEELHSVFIPPGKLAKMLDLTTERLRQLAAEGVIPKAEKGRYPLAASLRGYISFLTDPERRSARMAADVSLARAKTREIELRLNQKIETLMELEDVETIFEFSNSVYRECFPMIADAAGDDAEMRKKITDTIDGILTRHEKRCEAAIERLKRGEDPFQP